jgi:hypothetical protein
MPTKRALKLTTRIRTSHHGWLAVVPFCGSATRADRIFGNYFGVRLTTILPLSSGAMSAKDDEIGEIRDELEAYKKQLALVKEDLEIIIRFANPHLVGQANQYVTGNPSADLAVKEKCKRFVERWRHLVQQ